MCLNYKLVPASDYVKLPQLLAARSYGNKLILNNAIKEGKIPNTTYSIAANHAIYNATNGTLVYYKFNLTLKNTRGDTIKPVFVVSYNTVTKTQLLRSSSASIKLASSTTPKPTPTPTPTPTPKPTPTPTTPTTGQVLIPASQYSDATIQSLLLYGVNYVANQAIASGKLPKTTYKIKVIHSIYKQVLASSTNYVFDVEIQALDNSRIADTFYTINYKPATGAKLISKYSYKVLPY